MARTTDRKTLDTIQHFKDINHDVLIDHAKSLGGKKAKEALLYLKELNEKIPFTERMREEKRQELREKTKRKKIDGEFVDTGKRLYSEKQIDEKLLEIKEVPKHDIFTIKRLYCAEYWKEMLPKTKKSNEPTFEDKIAAALAEL